MDRSGFLLIFLVSERWWVMNNPPPKNSCDIIIASLWFFFLDFFLIFFSLDMYNILLYFSRDSGISLGEVLIPDTSQSQTLKIASSYHFKVYISSSSKNVKHTFTPLIYAPNVSRDITVK